MTIAQIKNLNAIKILSRILISYLISIMYSILLISVLQLEYTEIKSYDFNIKLMVMLYKIDKFFLSQRYNRSMELA